MRDKLLPFLNINILRVSELIYLWVGKSKFGISSVWPARKAMFSVLRRVFRVQCNNSPGASPITNIIQAIPDEHLLFFPYCIYYMIRLPFGIRKLNTI